MRIDVHAHYWTDDYLNLLVDLGKADAGAVRGIGAGGGADLEARLRPSAAARRMWYDTVGHGHVPALRCAIDSFGADRLLLGTDFPYENGDTFVRAVDYINDPQVDTIAARAILDQNADSLLRIGQERQGTAG